MRNWLFAVQRFRPLREARAYLKKQIALKKNIMELTDAPFVKIWRVKEKAWMTRHIDRDVLESQFANCSSTGLASTSQISTPSAIGCMMDLYNKDQCNHY